MSEGPKKRRPLKDEKLEKSTLRMIDLFAGAGGMSCGFSMAGFHPLFAVDHEKPALATYAKNHPGTVTTSEDIENLDPFDIMAALHLEPGELEVLVGGPPCQGFSTYGKRDPDDLRNQLYQHYLRFVEAIRPRRFVIENVSGILSMMGGAIIEDICARAATLGYRIEIYTLDAADYGVPQRRTRVFFLASREGAAPDLPECTNSRSLDHQQNLFGVTLPPAVTVAEAISDLPPLALPPSRTHESVPYALAPQSTYQAWARGAATEVSAHSAKQMMAVRRLRLALLRPGDYGSVLRQRIREEGLPRDVIAELLGDGSASMRDVKQCRTVDREADEQLRDLLARGHVDIDEVLASVDAGGFANKYRRLRSDSPSHTLVAHMARDCSDFVHPELDRFISVREAARLQSFPDHFRFGGSQFQQLRQIGNAVPPLLGRSVALAIRRSLSA